MPAAGTNSTSQRSTKGCWTCRLRRKKCDEGGMPCQTCASRNIHCHGYGPKPVWKDRGDKEREQAETLRLRRVSSAARAPKEIIVGSREQPTQASPTRGSPRPISATNVARPHTHSRTNSSTIINTINTNIYRHTQSNSHIQSASLRSTRASPSPPATPRKTPISPIDTDVDLNPSTLHQARESVDFSRNFACSPSSLSEHSFDPSELNATLFPLPSDFGYESFQQYNSLCGFSAADDIDILCSPLSSGGAISSFPFPSAGDSKACLTLDQDTPPQDEHLLAPRVLSSGSLQACDENTEREAGLVTHYISEVFRLQFRYCNTYSANSESGWLLLFLMRSTPFYHASLSISALYIYTNTAVTDTESRNRAFQDYQSHRVSAITEIHTLLAVDQPRVAPSGFLRETEILACAVQLSLLELFSGNIQSWQTYLQTALLSLNTAEIDPLSAHPNDVGRQMGSNKTSPHAASPTEEKALRLFRGTMIYVDILFGASKGTVPVMASTYHHMLDPKRGLVRIEETMGCENWVILTILQITELDQWKRGRESSGTLSLHELVNRSQAIEATLQTGIQQIVTTNSQGPAMEAPSMVARSKSVSTVTYIFSCAALVYLHAVVSGGRLGVPEIRQSVAKAVAAFKFIPNSVDLQDLMWPYCMTGCMAVNEERDMFRNLINSAGPDAQIFGNIAHVKTILEDCWTGGSGDAKVSDYPCDWRACMAKLDPRVLLI